MTRGDRNGLEAGWERDVERLVEHGRDREAVQLAARQLAGIAEGHGSTEPPESTEDE